MSTNVAARKDAAWRVVSMLPDVCKTPCGNSTPPIPYPVTAMLSSATKVVQSVRANGEPVVVFDQSELPTTQGDSPGSATGIKSGTVGGKCYPKSHSPTVRAGKKFLLRHDDEMWMNGQ